MRSIHIIIRDAGESSDFNRCEILNETVIGWDRAESDASFKNTVHETVDAMIDNAVKTRLNLAGRSYVDTKAEVLP